MFSTIENVPAVSIVSAGVESTPAESRCSHTPTTTTQTPQPQPWRRSVLPQNIAATGGVHALARRIGRPDVTHITGISLPQVETTLVASR